MAESDRRMFLKAAAATLALPAAEGSAQTAPPAGQACVATPTGNDTNFTTDLIGRRVCSSLDEVQAWLNAAGRENRFDVIIIGAGMFGSYLADKLFRKSDEPSK